MRRMNNIHIDIAYQSPAPRPSSRKAPYAICFALILCVTFIQKKDTAMAAVGGPTEIAAAFAKIDAESDMRRLRSKQAVLERREEILRYQLHTLELDTKRASTLLDPELQDELRRSRNMLVMLLRDQKDNDDRVADYLKQMWEAEGKTRVATMGTNNLGALDLYLSWPVEPLEGISAQYHDTSYEKRFGMSHNAIDIPTPQETVVRAAADGVVDTVADNGMGYNYIIIKHDDFATLYAHTLSFLVSEGDTVSEGDPIALSGGRPGTPGAGAISTGPHVHFELIVAGSHRDPVAYLPYQAGVTVVQN